MPIIRDALVKVFKIYVVEGCKNIIEMQEVPAELIRN